MVAQHAQQETQHAALEITPRSKRSNTRSMLRTLRTNPPGRDALLGRPMAGKEQNHRAALRAARCCGLLRGVRERKYQRERIKLVNLNTREGQQAMSTKDESFSLGLQPKPAYTGPRFTYQHQMPEWKRESARAMRRNPTAGEAELWRMLRCNGAASGLNLLRWHRQQTMFGYIVDFWCPKAKLVVEVDGPIHEGRVRYDATRDAALSRHGITTLRFTNVQVLGDMPQVIATIQSQLRSIPGRAL